MAQNSGFFNAFLSGGVYDRTYDANDYCDNLATIIKNGVVNSVRDDLKVSAYSGMTIAVGYGRAWINGHWYFNDAIYTGLTIATAPAGSNKRIDRVVLRLDTSTAVRSVSLAVLTGTAAASPVAPALTRSGDIYELALADITVAAGAITIANSNIKDLRADGTVCGWAASVTPAIMSMLQRYSDKITIAANTRVIQFNIAQYDATEGGTALDVYVNGIYTPPEKYTLSGNTITLNSGTLIAGTVVDVVLIKSIDGTGLASAAALLAELQQNVADLDAFGDFHYHCNGINDNVVLSQIAQAWLNGGDDYGSKVVHVYGKCGIAAPQGGEGTSANPYIWFRFGSGSATNRRIVFDFSGCEQITVPIAANTHNILFFGLHVNVKGANVVATESTATVYAFSTAAATVVHAERCRFWINALAGYVSRGGTFRDCRVSLSCAGADAFVFNVLSGSLLRVFGGEYYAYAATGNQSAVVYVNSAQTSAVAMTYGMNCPTTARSGFVQTYAINALTQNALCSFTDTITALTVQAAGQNIRGTLALSRAGLM